MKKLLTFAGVGAIAAMFGMVSPTRASTVINADGYQINVPTGISLVVDPSSNSDQLVLEKTANFVTVNQGLVISFTKTTSSAPDRIVINTENIANHTNSAWGQFLMEIFPNPTASITSVLNSSGTGFGPGSLSGDGNTVTYTGFQGIGDVSTWQGPSNLVINFTATDSMTDVNNFLNFKELPVGVPLPASAWMGLVGMLGIGALRVGKAKLFA